MLRNKIYQNYLIEITLTFLTILLSLSTIAWTVRAVNFLDLIVESGYSISTYLQYSLLNLSGILVKFFPLSFLLTLTMFIVKHFQENEFVILWTSSVKKIQIVHLLFISSIFILLLNLLLSIFITPALLNKSRAILSENNFSSFSPTIRVQEFSDSFSGLTFIVDEKYLNEVKNIFLQDSKNIFKSISSNQSDLNIKTIVASNGLIEEDRMILLNGQIISSNKNNIKNDIIEFDQLNIDLKKLSNRTIKVPKIQETSTIKLVSCKYNNIFQNSKCATNFKDELTPVLNRRIILPLFLPALALICSLLLLNKKKIFFLNKFSVFAYGFLILLFAELVLRYTGINNIINIMFLLTPIILSLLIYFLLLFIFSKEALKNE